MIHLVTALRAEAEPLAAALDLRRRQPPTQPGFDLWEGEEAQLVVSGVGRVASAAATAYLGALRQDLASVWMNVGVAAHRQLEIGEAIVAHQLVEAATGRVWFPQLIAEPTLPTATVCTVDRPIKSPEDDRVYEMEATGFFATATRWASAEVVACVKVISDHGVASEHSLGRAEVSELIAASAAEILAHGRSLVARLSEDAPPVEMEDIGAALKRLE